MMPDKPKGQPLPSDDAALDAAAAISPTDIASTDAYVDALGSPLLKALYGAVVEEPDGPA